MDAARGKKREIPNDQIDRILSSFIRTSSKVKRRLEEYRDIPDFSRRIRSLPVAVGGEQIVVFTCILHSHVAHACCAFARMRRNCDVR